jgi:hypothetical protein
MTFVKHKEMIYALGLAFGVGIVRYVRKPQITDSIH